MSKLIDPHICPDCRAPLDSAATCTGCGLRLTGPAAARLWARMQEADQLVEQLRMTPPAVPDTPPVAARPEPRQASPSPSLPSTSVPVVLLTLGGLCLLVAAIVFVAVAWSSLGLAAKTVILLIVTALVAAAAVTVTRRDLRFASETLWLVVSGLVAVDVAAAYGSDLLGLGRLGDRDALGLLGAVLLGLAVGAGAWATTTPLGRVHGLVAVGAAGAALLAGAEAWANAGNNPGAVAVSVPLLVALALAIDRVTDGHLRPTAAAVAACALVSWLELVGQGLERMASGDDLRVWWTELPGWPLLAAGGFAAVVAFVRRVPERARMVAAGACLTVLALFVVGPSSTPTADYLLWAVATVLVASVAAAAPRTWALPAAALSALGLVGWSVTVLARPLDVVSALPITARTDHAAVVLDLPRSMDWPSPWTAVVGALVVGIAAASLLRHLPALAVREASGRAFVALGPGAIALGATTALVETGPELWVAVLAWTTTAAVTAAMAVTVHEHVAPLGASVVFLSYLVLVDLWLATPSHLLSALVATLAALALAVAYLRARPGLLSGRMPSILAFAAVALAGVAATHWPRLAGGHGDAAALGAVGVAAACLLLARPARRDETSRTVAEGTALLVGLAATGYASDRATVALVLTVLGSAVAVVAVLNRDRDLASWVGVLLLGAATVLRLVEDVRAPEAYTLPAAAVLLGAGWWRLGSDQDVSSGRALSSGLTLALVPSLLLALDEPVSVRGALVAAGGLVALAVGVARHWSAPMVAGALVTGILAVRHLGPVVDALPRWISLGSVGLALLAVGVTWERRRRDVEATSRYLAALR